MFATNFCMVVYVSKLVSDIMQKPQGEHIFGPFVHTELVTPQMQSSKSNLPTVFGAINVERFFHCVAVFLRG